MKYNYAQGTPSAHQQKMAWIAAVALRNAVMAEGQVSSATTLMQHLLRFASQSPEYPTEKSGTTFTFADPPGIIYLNGILLTIGIDYAVMGNVVTTTFQIADTDELYAY